MLVAVDLPLFNVVVPLFQTVVKSCFTVLQDAVVLPLSKEVVDPLSLTVVVMYPTVKCINLAHHSG